MLKVPSPLEKAMGIVDQPGVCLTRAMSVVPLPLKAPATTRTPGPLAQLGIKLGAPPLVMLKVPSPLEKAMGMVDQPGVCLTRAMSFPSTAEGISNASNGGISKSATIPVSCAPLDCALGP